MSTKITTLIIFTLFMVCKSFSQVTTIESVLVNSQTTVNNCGIIDVGTIQNNVLTISFKLTKPSGQAIGNSILKILFKPNNFDYGNEKGITQILSTGWTNNNTEYFGQIISDNISANEIEVSGSSILIEFISDSGNKERSCEYSLTKTPTPTFTLGSSVNSINCASTAPVTFTVTNVYNSPGALSYNWNVGSGWSPSGNFTTTSNSIQLIPTSYPPSQVSVTPILNEVAQPQKVKTISLNNYQSVALISGSTAVCASEVYIITNLASNEIITNWSISNTSIATLSNINGNQATVTKIGNGQATITVTVSDQCNRTKDLVKTLSLGTPSSVTRLSHVSFGCTMGEIFARPVLGANQYEWQVTGAVIVDNNGGTTYIGGNSVFVDPIDTNTAFTVKVRAISNCGTSAWYTKTIPMDCSGGPTPLSTTPELDNDASEAVEAYPNPAKDQITVIVREDFKNSGRRPTEINAIRVLDQNSIERQYYTFKQNRTVQTIDISYLTPGLNFLLIYTNTGVVTKKILVK